MRQTLVKDWMTKDVVTIAPHTELPQAQRLMKAVGIRRLPVVENGCLLGIVTQGDIRGAKASTIPSVSVWELSFSLARLPVAEMMNDEPIVIRPEATIGQAAGTMLTHRIGGLPVVDKAGQLVGIITESDIFKLVVASELAEANG